MPAYSGLTLNLTVRTATAGHAAPRTADEAAALLTAQGRHVHLVSESDTHCLTGACIPALVDGLLGTAPRRRPHLSAPLPLT
ncbi:hypothetical protein ACW4TU_18595 [Streptomyces sp. QTS52]